MNKQNDLSKRLAANAIDFPIICIVFLILLFTQETKITIICYSIFIYVYLFIFPTIFRGQTLGKKIVKIKVVKNNHTKISILQVHLREIYKYLFVILSLVTTSNNKFLSTISNICFFLALVSFVVSFFTLFESKSRRTIHDLLAKTTIIDI